MRTPRQRPGRSASGAQERTREHETRTPCHADGETLRLPSASRAECSLNQNDNDGRSPDMSIKTFNADAPLTSRCFIEDHALHHGFHHLERPKAALGR